MFRFRTRLALFLYAAIIPPFPPFVSPLPHILPFGYSVILDRLKNTVHDDNKAPEN